VMAQKTIIDVSTPMFLRHFQLHKVNANTSRINLCESYVQHLCDKVDNQTVCTLIDSGSNMGVTIPSSFASDNDTDIQVSSNYVTNEYYDEEHDNVLDLYYDVDVDYNDLDDAPAMTDFIRNQPQSILGFNDYNYNSIVEQGSDSEFRMSVVESRMEEDLIRRIEHYNLHVYSDEERELIEPIPRTESLFTDTIISSDATRDFLRREIRNVLFWELRNNRIYCGSHGMILPITFCDDNGYVVCMYV